MAALLIIVFWSFKDPIFFHQILLPLPADSHPTLTFFNNFKFYSPNRVKTLFTLLYCCRTDPIIGIKAGCFYKFLTKLVINNRGNEDNQPLFLVSNPPIYI